MIVIPPANTPASSPTGIPENWCLPSGAGSRYSHRVPLPEVPMTQPPPSRRSAQREFLPSFLLPEVTITPPLSQFEPSLPRCLPPERWAILGLLTPFACGLLLTSFLAFGLPLACCILSG